MPFGFGEHWIKAEGLVVASREIGSKILGTWRTEWVVEVHAPGGEVFRSTIKWPFADQGFWPVSDGESIRIEYRAGSHELRWDKSDPRTNLFAKTPSDERARQDRAFADALAGRPAAAESSGARLDLELQELYDRQVAEASSEPAADGLEGLSFEFDADGRPGAGQVNAVVGAVSSGHLRTIRGSADQLLVTGTHGTAVITTASPLGKTVREINPNADPSRLDDPMWLFTVLVSVAGENPFPAVFGHRVPIARLATVVPGARLAVAVHMADRQNEVAIDWERSPLS